MIDDEGRVAVFLMPPLRGFTFIVPVVGGYINVIPSGLPDTIMRSGKQIVRWFDEKIIYLNFMVDD